MATPQGTRPTNERGQYGRRPGTQMQLRPEVDQTAPSQQQQPLPWNEPRSLWTGSKRPWTESQRRAFQRSIAISTIGSVAGAVLWKDHRVWGFILGGMAGGAIGNLAFAPPDVFP